MFCAKCQRAKAAHARKGSFPPGYTVAGCSSPLSTGGAGDRCHSSPSASSFSITIKAPDLVHLNLKPLSTILSFDPSRLLLCTQEGERHISHMYEKTFTLCIKIVLLNQDDMFVTDLFPISGKMGSSCL